METLKLIDQEFKKQIKIIYSLNMAEWISLAKSLNVALNHREDAAHKIAVQNILGKQF